MMIIDSHLDLSWNALNWKRDLTKSIAEIRRSEEGAKRPSGTDGINTPLPRRKGVLPIVRKQVGHADTSA